MVEENVNRRDTDHLHEPAQEVRPTASKETGEDVAENLGSQQTHDGLAEHESRARFSIVSQKLLQPTGSIPGPGINVEMETRDGMGRTLASALVALCKTNQGILDLRPPTDLDEAIAVNLECAQSPRSFIDRMPYHGDTEREESIKTQRAAKLGRSSSGAVVILCAAKFETWVNWCASGLDPTFHGLAEDMITEMKIPPLQFAKLVYAFCGQKFDMGKVEHADIRTIFQLRNELVHDKPIEPAYEERPKAVEKWRKKLSHRVPDLDWLPIVRGRDHGTPFVIAGESVVQKFMKYPVAKWAADATANVVDEMKGLLMVRSDGLRVLGRDTPIYRVPKDPVAAKGDAAGL